MDSVGIATTLIAQKSQATQTSIAAAIVKMAAEADASVIGLLQNAAQSQPAAKAPGTGLLVDTFA
jgi:hypothetical protein